MSYDRFTLVWIRVDRQLKKLIVIVERRKFVRLGVVRGPKARRKARTQDFWK